MIRTLAATCLVFGLAAAPSASSAQWGVSAEIGVARFAGSSRDSSGVTVGPYRPTTFELRADRGLGPARVALAVLYAKTGIAGEQPGLAVVRYDIASLWEVSPQVSFLLARFGVGVDVRLEAGPALQLWNLDGVRPRPHRVVTGERRLERIGLRCRGHADRRRAARDPTIRRRARPAV